MTDKTDEQKEPICPMVNGPCIEKGCTFWTERTETVAYDPSGIGLGTFVRDTWYYCMLKEPRQ